MRPVSGTKCCLPDCPRATGKPWEPVLGAPGSAGVGEGGADLLTLRCASWSTTNPFCGVAANLNRGGGGRGRLLGRKPARARTCFLGGTRCCMQMNWAAVAGTWLPWVAGYTVGTSAVRPACRPASQASLVLVCLQALPPAPHLLPEDPLAPLPGLRAAAILALGARGAPFILSSVPHGGTDPTREGTSWCSELWILLCNVPSCVSGNLENGSGYSSTREKVWLAWRGSAPHSPWTPPPPAVKLQTLPASVRLGPFLCTTGIGIYNFLQNGSRFWILTLSSVSTSMST